MAASDSRPVPRKNVAFRFYFPIRKNDGTLITTWAGQDSEVSLDGGAFADCTNEATEIGTSGVGYIDLTNTEMNADSVVYKLTVTNTGALPFVVTIFPEEDGDYRADATKIGGTAQTGRDLGTSVLLSSGTGTGQVKLSSGYIAPNWGDVGNPTTVVSLSNTTVKTATDVETDTQDIQSRLPAALTGDGNIKADALRIGGTTQTGRDLGASVLLSPGTGTGQVSLSSGAVTVGTNNDKTGYGLADGAITAAKIATDAIDADALASDAVTEIQSGLSTLDAAGVRSAVGLASANLDTQLDALPTAAENAAAVADEFATASDAVEASPTPTTTAFAGSTSLSDQDDFYNGSVVVFTAGDLDGIARKITDYTGSTRLITVSPAFPAAPAAADTFRIIGRID